MTITVTKIETKWDAKKTHEVSSHMFASIWMSAYEVLSKYGDKALEEFGAVARQHKLNYYKSLNIKTPVDMVRAIAETEHNVFGSQIEIHGDDKKASLKYLSCGMWEACEKMGKFTPEQEEKMGKACAESWTLIANEFGFNYEPKMEKDSYEMIFTVK